MHSVVDGETPVTMAKSVGLGTIELATHFEALKPDVVLTVADRFETIATAIAASYMNIPVAHTQGGEVTGSIDENVRHAITKLSHIHFPATERARDFLLRMGEQSGHDPRHRLPVDRCSGRERSVAAGGHLRAEQGCRRAISTSRSPTSWCCSIR